MAKKRKVRPLDPVAVLADAARRVEAGELEAARGLCERVLARAPERTDALELSTIIAQRRGEHAEALRFARRALEVAPTAKRHVALARASVGLGELARAAPALKEALRLDPADPTIYEVEAALRLAEGDPRAALEAAEGALALAPSRVESHAAHAAALEALERDADAAEGYRAGARARDGDRYGRLALLRAFVALLERTGEDEEAAQVRSLIAALG